MMSPARARSSVLTLARAGVVAVVLSCAVEPTRSAGFADASSHRALRGIDSGSLGSSTGADSARAEPPVFLGEGAPSRLVAVVDSASGRLHVVGDVEGGAISSQSDGAASAARASSGRALRDSDTSSHGSGLVSDARNTVVARAVYRSGMQTTGWDQFSVTTVDANGDFHWSCERGHNGSVLSVNTFLAERCVCVHRRIHP